MILPIVAYGHPVLRKEAKMIDADYPDLNNLIQNMWETLENANGVGLAAPQIGLSIRLFLVNSIPLMDEGQEDLGIKKVFINAELIEETGKDWPYEEGCLSIPDITGEVMRQPQIKIRYQDENFNTHEEKFTGMNARVIQHEYDHIEGILFIEYLKPVKKKLIRRKLENIKKGKVSADYAMKFVKQ